MRNQYTYHPSGARMAVEEQARTALSFPESRLLHTGPLQPKHRCESLKNEVTAIGAVLCLTGSAEFKIRYEVFRATLRKALRSVKGASKCEVVRKLARRPCRTGDVCLSCLRAASTRWCRFVPGDHVGKQSWPRYGNRREGRGSDALAQIVALTLKYLPAASRARSRQFASECGRFWSTCILPGTVEITSWRRACRRCKRRQRLPCCTTACLQESRARGPGNMSPASQWPSHIARTIACITVQAANPPRAGWC